MLMVYTTNDDLAQVRREVMELGVADWAAQHAEAAAIVDRALDVGWYRAHAAERGLDHQTTPFDGTRLLSADAQVKRLAAYKTLELIYQSLARGGESDHFGGLARHFELAYVRELDAVLAAGLDYDWDAGGALEANERQQRPMARKLVRQ